MMNASFDVAGAILQLFMHPAGGIRADTLYDRDGRHI
jgi:hypothetical protein